MAPANTTASLALWLHLRRRAALGDGREQVFTPPPGEGPLAIVHLSERAADPPPLAALIRAMLAKRPGLRFVLTGAQPPAGTRPEDLRAIYLPLSRDPGTVRRMIDALSPRVLLLVGDQLPSALITVMGDRGLPIILSEARLSAYTRRSSWRGAINRGLMHRISRILAPDLNAGTAARQLGAPQDRVELTGPVTETLPPPAVNEAERRALAQILAGRHVWLAAAPTLPEARAALAAHQSSLHHNHRALLVLAALPPEIVPPIRQELENLGLAAVLRSEDSDPAPDDHVLIAAEDDEMGLWYRLAPVCFMGGTLLPGPGLAPRHPFEPAALGSAIIHGPLTGAHAAEWTQLDGASAARMVADAAGLKRAVADLSAPDQAAMLAGNAWSVSTGGAAVLRRIASAVIDAMESRQ
ncbi:3-deoxy-D-manno-octulosonic-acid transferase [Paracoccus halophilus]|uniref:3-deoxy-D-manno-octulosonic acid transferase n=1 Tax=Paracoccus halophilus TaxID=376733 RepID=A0A099F171_9RHOB|nr:glycosyltransferase N-terminal domain-containing protein [Paracoccus halophilus]KGJ03917.1 3-deoxy-D-manno-octulosonic acid transferase [Paracoccus halophilus]SFA56595.1 3-deoxy-D-manno-octulosonic-acid transferase [Paracoccus halophilus]